MTILGIPMEKSIIIILFASSLFALIFSIMSFMGKVNGIKNYTADGITEEKTTPDKKENILSGFVFLSFSLTSFVGAMKYLTNIAILGYIAVALLLISLILFIISEKSRSNK